MTYYHCPPTFRGKPYGCGHGPVNATVAILDLLLKCPGCDQELKEVRSVPRKKMAAAQAHLDAAAISQELFAGSAAARYLASHRPRR